MKNTSNKISYISLTSQWADEKDDLLPIIERILSSLVNWTGYMSTTAGNN